MIGWSIGYLVAGYTTTALVTELAVVLLMGADPRRVGSTLSLALLQAAVGIGVFGGLTLLVGRRLLGLGRGELGWPPLRLGARALARGLLFGAAVAALALTPGALLGLSSWRSDGGAVSAYLGRVGVLALVLLPPAFMEELAFRGLPVAGLARAWGPGSAVLVTSVAFGLAHAMNPEVTVLGLGNITLAGILLGVMFLKPGGLWSATGAHLGWNLALASLGAPVSGLPVDLPWVDFLPGEPRWLTGGGFGPEGGLFATLALAAGVIVAARGGIKREGA